MWGAAVTAEECLEQEWESVNKCRKPPSFRGFRADLSAVNAFYGVVTSKSGRSKAAGATAGGRRCGNTGAPYSTWPGKLSPSTRAKDRPPNSKLSTPTVLIQGRTKRRFCRRLLYTCQGPNFVGRGSLLRASFLFGCHSVMGANRCCVRGTVEGALREGRALVLGVCARYIWPVAGWVLCRGGVVVEVGGTVKEADGGRCWLGAPGAGRGFNGHGHD